MDMGIEGGAHRGSEVKRSFKVWKPILHVLQPNRPDVAGSDRGRLEKYMATARRFGQQVYTTQDVW